MKPVIGITCYVGPARWGGWDIPASLLKELDTQVVQINLKDANALLL